MPNRWLVLTQILMLTVALVMLLFFRDLIATGASSVVGAFGTDDIQVQAPADPAEPRTKPAPLDIELESEHAAQPQAEAEKSAD